MTKYGYLVEHKNRQNGTWYKVDAVYLEEGVAEDRVEELEETIIDGYYQTARYKRVEIRQD